MFSAAFAGAMVMAMIGGVVRGVTGFGGAMVMTPTLSLLLGPVPAVLTALLLETFAAAPMLPAAARLAHWRVIAPICLAACITVPLGGYLLVTVEPQLMRRGIAATVVVFSLLMLAGFRYVGRQRLGTSLALGATSGILVGATSVGAPPVILYLLSGPDALMVTRANLTLFVAIISFGALAMLFSRGLLDSHNMLTALLLSPPYYIGIWLGGHLFRRISERLFRRWTLLFLVLVSSIVLVI